MIRFNQRWVNTSNLRLDVPEKVRRLKAFILLSLSNLPALSYLLRQRRSRVRMCAHTRARYVSFILDKVGMLDKALFYAAFDRLTCRPFVQP